MAKHANDTFTSKIQVDFTNEQWDVYIQDCLQSAAELIDLISPAELDDLERENMHRLNTAE